MKKICKDRYGRIIDYLRISITDRCNLRCRYCMPEGVPLTSMQEILTYEEIAEVSRAAAGIGIRKFKITGGEPLVRRGCASLIGMLKQIPGVEQVTLTTNGILLGDHLEALLANGLDAVNVSLDTLRPDVYRSITGRDGLEAALFGIRQAAESGLKVKINSVLLKGINDGEWRELLRFARKDPVDVRFIEMMPIGFGKQFPSVSNTELLEQIRKAYPGLEKDRRIHGNGPAVYYRIPGFSGSVGLISAIHGKFCKTCSRLRMTAQGEIKPCLCYGESIPLKEILRPVRGAKDAPGMAEKKQKRLEEALKAAADRKPSGHCFEDPESVTETKQMIQIGG